MHTKAEIAATVYKATYIGGPSITTLAFWNANSPAIGAICAVITVIVVTVTATIRSTYDRKIMEATLAQKEKPVKEEKPVSPIEPASVPCGDEKNPC